MVLVSVHQPNFMPWPKLVAKIAASDVYVGYDTVQFNRYEYHARQRFPARHGGVTWLGAPIVHTGRRQPLREVRLVDAGWRAEHLAFLDRTYRSAPYFTEVYPLIERVYAAGHDYLVGHNIGLIRALCGYLGFDARIVLASELAHSGSREQRLLDLVQACGGDEHLSSTTTTHEIDWSVFHRAGIPVWLQEFDLSADVQNNGVPAARLSAVDMAFRLGRSAAMLIRSATTLVAEPGSACRTANAAASSLE